MEDGNINPSSAGTYALLLDTLRAGRGGGSYGGGEGGTYGSHHPYTDSASIHHAVLGNRQATENDNDCTRTLLGKGLDSIRDSFEGLVRDNQFTSLTKSISDAEFRSLDRQRDIERVIADNAKAAAECCCGIKQKMCEDKAELKSEILAVETRTISRELDTANRIILEMKIAAGNGHGGGH